VARRQIGPDIERLKQLEHAEPEQEKLLDELSGTVSDKFAELHRTIALAQAGNVAAAIDLVKSNRGRESMDAARKTLSNLLARADIRLRADTEDMTGGARYLSFATIAGASLVFVFGLGSLFIVVRYTRDLVRARAAILSRLTTTAALGSAARLVVIRPSRMAVSGPRSAKRVSGFFITMGPR